MNAYCKSYSHFFGKKFQHIRVSLDVNLNESLTNDIVSFEQLDPGHYSLKNNKINVRMSYATNLLRALRVNYCPNNDHYCIKSSAAGY